MRVQSVEQHRTTSIVPVVSGKSGVCNTNVIANLAFALTKLQRNVLLLDGDLSFGTFDIMLSATPSCTEEHLFSRYKSLREIIQQ